MTTSSALAAAQPGPDRQAFTLRDVVGPADSGRVADLVAATGFFNHEEIAIARELVDEHLAKGRASGYWFVFAERYDAELLGYACCGPVPGTLSSWHLYWIAVAPDAQQAGLGRALLCRVENMMRNEGGERLYAETSSRPQYLPTRRFYLRTGFVEVASLPDFFAPGDGKVIFLKDVASCAAATS